MEKIIKIALLVAVAGLVMLFFVTKTFSEEVTKIEDLKIGQMETIKGMLTDIYISRDGHAFLKVADNTGEIPVVVFKSSNIEQAYSLEVGDEVSVMGRVEEYKQKPEIIAKEIKLL